MIVGLPWPDARLTPNAKRRKHWRTYQPIVKQAREMAHIETVMQVPPEQRSAFKNGNDKIPVSVTFYPPDRRKRDDDGMIGQFKPYRDGICDALGIDDHRWKTSYTVADPCKPGRIEVVIGECDEQD